MLLNDGVLDGSRMLSSKTLSWMTSDQLLATTERHTPLGPLSELGTNFGGDFWWSWI
jgi:hypothetical protein